MSRDRGDSAVSIPDTKALLRIPWRCLSIMRDKDCVLTCSRDLPCALCSPRWVDGELLVFAVGASPVTGGAELGFVWSVPGEKRFLILLSRINLKECEK